MCVGDWYLLLHETVPWRHFCFLSGTGVGDVLPFSRLQDDLVLLGCSDSLAGAVDLLGQGRRFPQRLIAAANTCLGKA